MCNTDLPRVDSAHAGDTRPLSGIGSGSCETIGLMPNTSNQIFRSPQPSSQQPQQSSHGKLFVVVIAAVVVIVLSLLSAFVWPGWAINRGANASGESENAVSQTDDKTGDKAKDSEPTKPSIAATPLADGSSELVKALPDSVLNYVRSKVETSAQWSASSPLEEYTVTYSTGVKSKDVTLIVAQWSTATNAKAQYDSVVAALTGDELASGNVKVSGTTTGTYTVHKDASNEANSVAVWQNDTVVFQATGAKAAVDRFYKEFPL